MKREITFNFTTEQKMFKAFVTTMQPVLNLRDREADVFAQLLYYNFLKKDIKNLKDRFELVFSTKTKKLIMQNLDIKDSILQNTLSILRKKNLIINNEIPLKFHIYPTDNKIELTFNFKLKENE
jgi:hypothetical protein